MKRKIKAIAVAMCVTALLVSLAGCSFEYRSDGSAEPLDLMSKLEKETGVILEDEVSEATSCPTYEETKKIISVNSVHTSTPNSADGVDITVKFTNKSNKTIKYITFTVVPYNAVNDVVSCEIRGRTTANLQVTGPIIKDEDNQANFENVWYNSTIKKCEIESVKIDYMDGTSIAIGAAGLNRPESEVYPYR